MFDFDDSVFGSSSALGSKQDRIVKHVTEAAATASAAFGLAYVQKKYDGASWVNPLGIDLGLIVGVAFTALAAMEVLGDSAEINDHVAAFGNGAFALWAAKMGAGLATPKVAGATGGAMGMGSPVFTGSPEPVAARRW